MGMDVYGLCPGVRKTVNVDNTLNDGIYFGATCSAWRDIIDFCNVVVNDLNKSKRNNYGINTNGWSTNDFDGIKDASASQFFASCMADMIDLMIKESNLTDDELFLLNNGNWRNIKDDFWFDDDKTTDEIKSYEKIAEIWKLKRFVSFVNNSGGFEIW